MPSNIPYAPQVSEFKGSDEFSYLAKFYEEHGVYTTLTEDTFQWKEFWKDVKNKCLAGFTNSYGIKITGQHFFYLNFVQILGVDKGKKKKTKIFPRFVDLDYDWFWVVDHCRNNGLNLCQVKGRRQGCSYKAGAVTSHEYTFYKDSKNIISAFLSDFSDNTMAFALDNLNFLKTNTPFGHLRDPDKSNYVQARYKVDVGGVKVYKGYHSVIESITFKDKPTAAVGKSCTWLVMDEAGVWPNIIQAWGYSEPLVRDGNIATGTALMFGSAGSMEGGSQYFYDIFINPEKYNMLSFPDPEVQDKRTGYFSSSAKGRWGICRDPESKWYKQPMVDDNGNSNEDAATDDIMWERNQARGSANPQRLHEVITQYPLTYQEAFLRSKGAIFAGPELAEWLAKVETTALIREDKKVGELYFDSSNKLQFRLNPDLKEITDFPIKANDSSIDKTGSIVIYEDPERVNGDVPSTLYIAGCDPYDQDKSQTGSLGSFFVYKRFYRADRTHDIVVAEYTGRPQFADDFYENCRKLCIYYNAKVLYENQLKGFKGYFEQKNSLHYLYEQPQIIRDIVKDSRVMRGYGIHMQRGNAGSSGIKDTCELYLKDWLYTERVDIDGRKVLNLHTIKSIGLLKELLAYDPQGNYDRVIAFMLCILQSKELHKIHLQDMVINNPNNPAKFLENLYQKNRTKTKYKSPFIIGKDGTVTAG